MMPEYRKSGLPSIASFHVFQTDQLLPAEKTCARRTGRDHLH
jgi:hypothetical protein